MLEKKTLQDATMVRNYNVIHCTPTYIHCIPRTRYINCAIGEVKVIFLFDLSLSSGLRKFYFYWNFRFRCNDFTIFHVSDHHLHERRQACVYMNLIQSYVYQDFD